MVVDDFDPTTWPPADPEGPADNAPWYLREAGWCGYQVPGVCTGRATTTDHRIHRSQGGTRRVSNLVAACAMCNVVWKEAHPDEAASLGWTLSAGTDTEAAPVFLRHRVMAPDGGWFLLDDRFGVTPTEAPR
jgi:hypothetical protein